MSAGIAFGSSERIASALVVNRSIVRLCAATSKSPSAVASSRSRTDAAATPLSNASGGVIGRHAPSEHVMRELGQLVRAKRLDVPHEVDPAVERHRESGVEVACRRGSASQALKKSARRAPHGTNACSVPSVRGVAPPQRAARQARRVAGARARAARVRRPVVGAQYPRSACGVAPVRAQRAAEPRQPLEVLDRRCDAAREGMDSTSAARQPQAASVRSRAQRVDCVGRRDDARR